MAATLLHATATSRTGRGLIANSCQRTDSPLSLPPFFLSATFHPPTPMGSPLPSLPHSLSPSRFAPLPSHLSEAPPSVRVFFNASLPRHYYAPPPPFSDRTLISSSNTDSTRRKNVPSRSECIPAPHSVRGVHVEGNARGGVRIAMMVRLEG